MLDYKKIVTDLIEQVDLANAEYSKQANLHNRNDYYYSMGIATGLEQGLSTVIHTMLLLGLNMTDFTKLTREELKC